MSAPAKLYAMAHSHPAIAARMMLEHKGIEAEVWNILPGLHPFVVRGAGFPGRTVPALRIGERRVQGTLPIARALDQIRPDPPLLPADPAAREAVLAAERWGHDELQTLARRVFRYAALRSNALRAWLAGEIAGLPAPAVAGFLLKPVIAYYARVVGADEQTVRDDLRRLPDLLDQVDALIAEGTIGGPSPNAADFQILCSVRLLLGHPELGAVLEGRRCAAAALALVPSYPGPVPRALPDAWIAERPPVPAAAPP